MGRGGRWCNLGANELFIAIHIAKRQFNRNHIELCNCGLRASELFRRNFAYDNTTINIYWTTWSLYAKIGDGIGDV